VLPLRHHRQVRLKVLAETNPCANAGTNANTTDSSSNAEAHTTDTCRAHACPSVLRTARFLRRRRNRPLLQL
jgi:hypothetical protein